MPILNVSLFHTFMITNRNIEGLGLVTHILIKKKLKEKFDPF